MNLGVFTPSENAKIKKWYTILNYLFRVRNSEVDFLNLGYMPSSDELTDYSFINKNFRNELTARQKLLYYMLLKDLEKGIESIGEISCGLGGGAKFIHEYYYPKSYVGFEPNKYSFSKCSQKFKNIQNFKFHQSDYNYFIRYERKFNSIVCLEASLHFENVQTFYSNVYNSLDHNGCFFYGDIFNNEAVSGIEKHIQEIGFTLIKKTDVTENIINSILLIKDENLLNNLLHTFFLNNRKLSFSAGTEKFEKLKNREYLYLLYTFSK